MFDFDDTYQERLAAALASGKISIVPHRIKERDDMGELSPYQSYLKRRREYAEREKNSMEVTLNGVTMRGTPEQLAEIARKLGVELGNDGIWYNSTSRGLIMISQMEENHVRNTIAKRYKAHFENLKGLDSVAFAKALSGPQDKTTVALVARLVQINYENQRKAAGTWKTYR